MNYIVKFLNKNQQLGVRKISNYKIALKEAERWVLSGHQYISRIEWETITGSKFLELNIYTVKQQRQARIAYKKIVRNNKFQNPYIS